jgi:hypothetical protein
MRYIIVRHTTNPAVDTRPRFVLGTVLAPTPAAAIGIACQRWRIRPSQRFEALDMGGRTSKADRRAAAEQDAQQYLEITPHTGEPMGLGINPDDRDYGRERDDEPDTMPPLPPGVAPVPWRFEMEGDGDGERFCCDYFVLDANGDEIACPPDEATGHLQTAAPAMYTALVKVAAVARRGWGLRLDPGSPELAEYAEQVGEMLKDVYAALKAANGDTEG